MSSLSRAALAPDPVEQFGVWLDDATAHGLPEPTAMALATVAADGRPSSRMVLLKHFDPAGFVFATNYESRKARDLASNPRAALLFHWHGLDRQVRIEGLVERDGPARSDAIFRARPRGARLGAWSSPQSRILSSRVELDARRRDVTRRFPGDVPRPPFWGAFRLAPDRFEFWQGRTDRLHDRFRYVRTEQGPWQLERLAP